MPICNDNAVGGPALQYGFALRIINQAGSSCGLCKHWLLPRAKGFGVSHLEKGLQPSCQGCLIMPRYFYDINCIFFKK